MPPRPVRPVDQVLFAGDDQGRDLIVQRAQALQQLQAGVTRQVVVEDRQVDVVQGGGRRCRQGLFGAAVIEDPEALGLELQLQQKTQPPIIFDQQNGGLGGGGVHVDGAEMAGPVG